MYKFVTRVIKFFYFPDNPKKGGNTWISRKVEILERGVGWSRKGGYDLPYQLWLAATKNLITNYTFFANSFMVEVPFI